MNTTVNFNCFIKVQDTNWETFEFRMSDIYISELNKWIKADSPDDAKAFFNLDVLKTVRSFAFYTTSESTARWALTEKRILKDFFEYKKAGHKFKLKIVAVSNSLNWIVECVDCQPVQSVVLPTPFGTMQSYVLKYTNALIQKL